MEPKLEKVDGHPYSRVLSGPHKGQYLNQTANKRQGEFFRLVEQAGRMQHVYGTGKDREVLTMPAAPPAAKPTPTAPGPAAPGVATDVSREAAAPAPKAAAAAPKAAAPASPAASSSPATDAAARLLAATGGLVAPDEA